MSRSLDGRTAVVTGSSRGLGRATAIQLGKQGAFVIVNYRSSEDAAAETLEQIRDAGGDGMLKQADVTDADAVKTMFNEIVAERGGVDILVNNAGITRDIYFIMMKRQQWTDVVNTHLNGAFNCTKAIIRHMCAQGSGVIINIGSGAGFSPTAGQTNYGAAKAGLIGFSRTLAREVADNGVRVLLVAPGFFQTDMTEVLGSDIEEEAVARTPLGRWGRPPELASVIGFLVSDDASYITGQSILVDGGRCAVETNYGLEKKLTASQPA